MLRAYAHDAHTSACNSALKIMHAAAEVAAKPQPPSYQSCLNAQVWQTQATIGGGGESAMHLLSVGSFVSHTACVCVHV